MIRPMRADDMPYALGLLRRAFEEMDYAHTGFTFDPVTVAEVITRNIDTAFVCDGGLGAYAIVPSIMNANDARAVEYIWHSDPAIPQKLRRMKIMMDLAQHMEQDVKKRGIKHFTIAASVRMPTTHRLLERSGYEATELSFTKEV